jgi:hypothetical protein
LSEEKVLALQGSSHGRLFYSEPKKTISGCVEKRNDIDPAGQSATLAVAVVRDASSAVDR